MTPQESYLYEVMAHLSRQGTGETSAFLQELVPRVARPGTRIIIKVVGDGLFPSSVEATFEAVDGQSPTNPAKRVTLWMPVYLEAHG